MNINNHFSTQHRKFKKSTLQLLAGAMFLLLQSHANAADFTKRIIVTTGAEYDSNPSMVEKNQKPVWLYTLIPQLQLDANDEVNRWFLGATMLVQRPSNESVLTHREDPKLAMGWERTYESGLYGIKADYSESSARLTELKSTGVISNIDNTQKTKVLAATWQHDINPRWSVLTEGIYTDIMYSAPGVLGSYNLSEIRSKLTYANTEKLDTYAQLGYLHYSPDNKLIDNTDFYRLMLGANYQLKEGLTLGARGGVYNISGRQSDSGLEAGVNAGYIAERMNYKAELYRSLGAGGIGGFQKTDTLTLAWLYNISELGRVGADFGLNKSKADKEINVANVDYQQISVFYERSLDNHWQTRFTAAQRWIDTTDIHSRANVIGVTLTYDTLSF
ncbi:MAG: hypothetical protein ACXW11_04520 [Methylotenera sp.]